MYLDFLLVSGDGHRTPPVVDGMRELAAIDPECPCRCWVDSAVDVQVKGNELHLGRWPDALGIRCHLGKSWWVESDCASATPIFHAQTPTGIIVSSSMKRLFGAVDGALDELGVLDLLGLGFIRPPRTIFNAIRRLSPGCRLHSDGICAIPAAPVAGGDALGNFIESTARLRGTGETVALELTAGVDSGFVLAALMAAGTPPDVAFTIGEDDKPDVEVARCRAKRLGIPHHCLAGRVAGESWLSAAKAFIEDSGFGISLTANGLIPSLLSPLEDVRDAQIGGTGGEIVGGFYDLPGFGRLANRLAPGLVVRRKIVNYDGSLARGIARDSGRWRRQLRQSILLDLRRRRFNDPGGSELDGFYREGRVAGWAGPVLHASSRLYDVMAPLLSEPFCALASASTFGRGQMQAFLEKHLGPTAPSPRQRRRVLAPVRSLFLLREINSVGDLQLQSADALDLVERARSALSAQFGMELRPDLHLRPVSPDFVGNLMTIGLAVSLAGDARAD